MSTSTASIVSDLSNIQTPSSDLSAGNSLIARGTMLVLGMAMILSSLGVWIVPGSDWSPELALIKLGLSVFMALFGLICLQGSKANEDANA